MEYVKDFLLTEAFLVKGHVPTGGQRLSNWLNARRQPFVPVADATLVGVKKGDRIVTARCHVALDEVLLAHELIDAAGDAWLRRLADADRERALVHLYFGGSLPLEISGRTRAQAFNRVGDGARDFLVVTEPKIEGLDHSRGREFEVLRSVPYVIVNRRRLAYVFDYSA